jgi:hypothetical protein
MKKRPSAQARCQTTGSAGPRSPSSITRSADGDVGGGRLTVFLSREDVVAAPPQFLHRRKREILISVEDDTRE